MTRLYEIPIFAIFYLLPLVFCTFVYTRLGLFVKKQSIKIFCFLTAISSLFLAMYLAIPPKMVLFSNLQNNAFNDLARNVFNNVVLEWFFLFLFFGLPISACILTFSKKGFQRDLSFTNLAVRSLGIVTLIIVMWQGFILLSTLSERLD
jgi:hypothetical protein